MSLIIKSTKTTGADKKNHKKHPDKLEFGSIEQITGLDMMALGDLAVMYGSWLGYAKEGICVATGSSKYEPGEAIPQSFISKGMISKGDGIIPSDPGVKVITSSQTRAMIKDACKELGVAEAAFTHRSLRKNFATANDDNAKAYATYMAKNTTGGGQWAEGSTTVAEHYITCEVKGMLSLLDDGLTAEEHAARNLEEMKEKVYYDGV